MLDKDPSVSPTQGEQEKSVWNGHFECTCYNQLLVFDQFGDLERRAQRPGNAHSADGCRGVLGTVVERYRQRGLRRYFRGDVAFAPPDIYGFLEAAGYEYTIRVLDAKSAHLDSLAPRFKIK
jgi:hypothetical protein